MISTVLIKNAKTKIICSIILSMFSKPNLFPIQLGRNGAYKCAPFDMITLEPNTTLFFPWEDGKPFQDFIFPTRKGN